jgi:hypothetical protein
VRSVFRQAVGVAPVERIRSSFFDDGRKHRRGSTTDEHAMRARRFRKLFIEMPSRVVAVMALSFTP